MTSNFEPPLLKIKIWLGWEIVNHNHFLYFILIFEFTSMIIKLNLGWAAQFERLHEHNLYTGVVPRTDSSMLMTDLADGLCWWQFWVANITVATLITYKYIRTIHITHGLLMDLCSVRHYLLLPLLPYLRVFQPSPKTTSYTKFSSNTLTAVGTIF